MNQHRERVYLTGHHEVIKERWYAAGGALLRPIRVALSQVYPLVERNPDSEKYNAKSFAAYEEKLRLANDFLYEQRNLVNNKWLPRYEIGIAAPGSEPTEAYQELEALLVDGCLDRLFENLAAYAPMLLPTEKAKEVFETLPGVLEVESKHLREFLPKYRVRFRKSITPISDNL